MDYNRSTIFKHHVSMRKLSIILFFALLCINSFAQKAYYYIELNNVQKDGVAINNESISIQNEKGLIRSTYTDSIIQIQWCYHPTQVAFDLTNKSGKTIKVDWNDGIYVGTSGYSDKIYHYNVKIADRENKQELSPMLSDSKISDVIMPINKVSYSDYFGRWVHKYLITKDDFVDNGNIKIQLPIVVEDKTISYIFSFKTKKEERKVKTEFVGNLVFYKEQKSKK